MVGTRAQKQAATRRLFDELMDGVLAMRRHQRGRLALQTSDLTAAHSAKKATRRHSARRGGVADRAR